MIFAGALDPSVKAIMRLGVPRWLSITTIYLIFLGIIGLTIYLLIPAVSTQIKTIIDNLPIYQARLEHLVANQPFLYKIVGRVSQAVSSQSESAGMQVVSLTVGVFGSLVGFLTFLVLTFYMLTGGKKLGKSMVSFIPDRALRARIVEVGGKVSVRLGGWLRGQAILSVTIFVMALVMLIFMRVDFALTLALIAGITELIPLVGAYLGAIPAVMVAFTQSPTKALIVAIGYVVIQLFEGNVIVPQVMKRTLGLPPIVVFVAILIGGKLLGIVGVLLAAPVAAAVSVIIEDLLSNRQSLGQSASDS